MLNKQDAAISHQMAYSEAYWARPLAREIADGTELRNSKNRRYRKTELWNLAPRDMVELGALTRDLIAYIPAQNYA